RRHTRSKRDWSSDVCSSDLHSSFRVEAVLRSVQGRRGNDFYVVLIFEPRGECLFRISDLVVSHAQFAGKVFRSIVEVIEVVLACIKEIAHYIMWHRWRLGAIAGSERHRG